MPARLRYPELAPEGIASLRAVEHYLNAATALPAVLLEMVRLRVSLLNGCDFCVGHHTGELRKHHEPESRIAALRGWQNSDAFTPKERAALAWADSVTEIQSRHADDTAYAAVATFFHDKDLVDLTLAVASINAWNRMSIAFRAGWDPMHRETSANVLAAAPSAATHEDALVQAVVEDDGGKVAHD